MSRCEYYARGIRLFHPLGENRLYKVTIKYKYDEKYDYMTYAICDECISKNLEHRIYDHIDAISYYLVAPKTIQAFKQVAKEDIIEDYNRRAGMYVKAAKN